ncbi:acyltransferase family protein [Nocardiopsis ganjiahuensis]|uniref:acyltransferase family protein n=1 Tax=Nocardiopsis ganjiahuensis TaxID=239984 RepID=UPI000347150B|nr:acyltransferase family protein [Nocardiopsis ganjiahuensis]
MRSPDFSSPQVAAAPERSAARAPGSRFRPEVQGLRAVAVLLVLVYHLNPELLPGGYVGVDVFFVISGFLITSLLLREVREHGRVSLAGFYVRRVRRLLPAATVVLLATGAASVVLLPVTRLGDTAWQLLASAAYVENLYLGNQALDYLAAETAPSPVQHFWSLSVEEQFYVVWPLLFVLWALLLRRGSLRRGSGAASGAATAAGTGALTVLLASVFAASLVCSLLLTSSGAPSAYFLPTTRAWELAAGGLLALFLAERGLPEPLRLPLGWAGLAAVVASAVLYDSGTPFPGYAALLPVLGCVAVIAAERSPGPSAATVLSTGPARFVGDISYALYLWHWPLIVFALALLERDTLGPLGFVAVAALSFLLAWATKLWVEDPVARHGLVRTGRGALAVALVGILSVGAVTAAALARVDSFQAGDFDPAVHVGPEAIGLPSTEGAWLYPSPVGAEDDTPQAYDDGCHAGFDKRDPSDPCVYGPEDADTTVALTGDSHSTQWFPALDELGRERGWRIVVFNKSACAFTATEVSREGTLYEECSDWNRAVVGEIDALEPDLLITSSSAAGTPYGLESGPEARDAMAEGMVELWGEVAGPDTPLLVIRDTPRTTTDVLDCLASYTHDLSACDRPASAALELDDPQELAAREVEGAELIDLTDMICTDGACPAVIGNVVVYRDSHHLTETYARLLSDALGTRMDEALDSP